MVQNTDTGSLDEGDFAGQRYEPPLMDQETRTWAMFLHFSLLLGFVIPFAGLVAPILIWQLKKNELPEIDEHGKMVLNYLLSMFIYGIVGFILTFVFVGIIVLMALAVVAVIYPIIGGIKANSGELWRYPLILNLIS